jgi:hypothetical protein
MAARQRAKQLSDIAPGFVIAGAVCLLALPSAVLAFSNRLDISAASPGSGHAMSGFAAGSLDQRLADALAVRPAGKGPLFRFTPAGLATRPDRSVTVAVRVDQLTASSIIVHAHADTHAAPAAVPLRLASGAYNLGVARGYQAFGGSASGFVLQGDRSKPDIPDLSAFASADSSASGPAPRLSPRLLLNERDRAGRAPRTLESVGEQSVDLGGSYRLTPRIDVTAGVRYSQDRDRLKPPSETKADNQAVYVGTQFRF